MPALHATGTLGILSSSELDRDIAGVQGTYGWSVQSGAVTFSATLTFNVAAVAAGDYTVNSVSGSLYAGGTVTLGTQDPTNPRVDVVVITSAGAVSVVAGTPKALTTTSGPVPTAPSSTQLEIARIFVPASGTALTSANITDRRHPIVVGAVALAGSSSAATSTTSTSAVDLVTVSGLSIATTTPFRVEFNARKQALAANAVVFGWKINATVMGSTLLGGNGVLLTSSATNQAEDGIAVVSVAPRSSANYLNGVISYSVMRNSSTGAATTAPAFGPGGSTSGANVPNATITSIAIRAINDTASNAAEVFSVRILTGLM